jgi:hypothetical protein
MNADPRTMQFIGEVQDRAAGFCIRTTMRAPVLRPACVRARARSAGPTANRVAHARIDGAKYAHSRSDEVLLVVVIALDADDLDRRDLRLHEHLEPEPDLAKAGLPCGELVPAHLEIEPKLLDHLVAAHGFTGPREVSGNDVTATCP